MSAVILSAWDTGVCVTWAAACQGTEFESDVLQVVNVTPRYAKLKGNDKREVSFNHHIQVI
jgi:hypothetical protein